MTGKVDRSQTREFIGTICKAMGKPAFVMENYPSGYWIDFPPAVERVWRAKGIEEADKYVRRVFHQEHCRDADSVERPGLLVRLWRKTRPVDRRRGGSV